ncbi:MAG: phosphoenolpyruvate synthase [Lachnospiraceae bacterium]|nr:phosphoenolpyruvate synthase [Lachnospiraceae bacterium]
MKARNLQILKENGFPVPDFIVVNSEADINMSFSNASSFAVRSSYYLEDEEESSFAGQFETVLNVKRENIGTAVFQVRESYNRRLYRNMQDNGTASPVIIQEMVEADMSGVIFTANPLGILNEAVITAGLGLGKDIVEDKAETVTYYYNQDESLFYIKEKSDIFLEPEILKALIGMAFKIRDLFEGEMDIEFAVKSGAIYILQARPITTLHRAENPIILDNSNIVESYPGISLPATQDFVHNIYRDIFKSCIFRITKNADLVQRMDPIFDNMVAVYRGGIYYQINNWYEILRLLPFSDKIIGIWQEMLGVDSKTANQSSLKVSKWLKFKIVMSFLYYLLRTPASMKKLNRYFDEIYPIYGDKIGKADTAEDLLTLFDRIEKAVTEVWDITLINDMYTFLFTALAGGKKNKKITNIKNLESMKPILAMNDLRTIAMENGFESKLYQEKEKEYIALFGDRVLGELKLESKTYRTHPELLKKQILGAENIQVQSGKPKKNINPVVRAAKCGIANREKSRLNRSRLFGLAREIMLKTGGILTANGQLVAAEDIFYLYPDEIKPGINYQELIEKRKEQFRRYETFSLPKRMVFADGIIEDERIGYDEQFKHVTILQGIQTSLGRVNGEAIVIEKVRADLDVKDKILITKSTDPGWVFLLENCKGIVAEQGSLLSHTAIISRELKKPAVVNVKDATKIIQTGDVLELNADAGTVKILKRKA